MRVMIVDDSRILCARLSEMISEYPDIEIVGEAQGEVEAIRLFKKLNPEAVILDIRLKKGSGIEVLERIKTISPKTIVIMLTNYPYPQYRTKCLTLGADHFFDKSKEIEKVNMVFQNLFKSPQQSFG